jgi:glycine dehydrogenase
MAALRIGSRSTSRHVERRVLTASRRELATAKLPTSLFAALDTFSDRHIGPDNAEAAYMLSKLGYSSMESFVDEAVPPKIRIPADAISDKAIGPLSEAELLRRAKLLGAENKPFKSYIGMGYHNAVVPPVILRNVSPVGESQGI